MIDLPPHHFRTIVADPPWSFKTWSNKGKAKSPEQHYDTMSLEDIKALPVGDAAAEDCLLLMWAVNPMLPQAFATMDAWGFSYKTIGFCWAKASRNSDPDWAPKWHMGLGYWTRANVEVCLLGVRGKPKRCSKAVRQLIVDPVREHSRKPDEFYNRVMRLAAGPYLELFSRQEREGWTTWGIERQKFPRMVCRDSIGTFPTR